MVYDRALKSGALVLGAAVGATSAYLLDSHAGARRRSAIVDKTHHWQKLLSRSLSRSFRNISNFVSGRSAAIYLSLMPHAEPDDQTLIARIRSKAGRRLSHPRMLKVSADAGKVTISGYALAHEIPRLYSTILKVSGVKAIVANNVVPVESEQRMSSLASAKL